MAKNFNDFLCFSSIEISNPVINLKSAKSFIILNKINNDKFTYQIVLKYDEPINPKNIALLRLAFCMPLLNYGLFTKKFILRFPVSKEDLKLLNHLNKIFSRDIFVNKILRRRANYILPDFLPNEKKVKLRDSESKAVFFTEKIIEDKLIASDLNSDNCGILSSGGKESLLTYGILKEIGANVHPLYINESGGHWRTALTAYRYHKKNESNTQRVWTNIDRFYVFMLDNLKFIRPDHRKVWADTYPIRLCIFPFYVFALLPIFADKKIANLIIGSEFDDIRVKPVYHRIKHYSGVYDQHQDYDILMNNWYEKRMPGLFQWSAVRNISGLIVERILVKRYPELSKLQRSCHSCHFENNEIVPCGNCSKCIGVLLFLLANKVDPKIMNFREKDIELSTKRINPSNLRIDEDEKNQSFYLIGEKGRVLSIKPIYHVEKIHINKENSDLEHIPSHFRKNILKIIKSYTTGFCELKNKNWSSLEESKINF